SVSTRPAARPSSPSAKGFCTRGGLVYNPPPTAPSPSGKASDSVSDIRWFESIRGCHLHEQPAARRVFCCGDLRLHLRLSGNPTEAARAGMPAYARMTATQPSLQLIRLRP